VKSLPLRGDPGEQSSPGESLVVKVPWSVFFGSSWDLKLTKNKFKEEQKAGACHSSGLACLETAVEDGE